MNKNNILKQDEELEDLQINGMKIIQSKSLYRLTSDSVILSNFIKAKQKDKVVDLGTGSGIIAILTTVKNNLTNTFGVELQTELADMARRSVEYNSLQERVKILNLDMKQLFDHQIREKYGLNAVDVVVCNPPYKKAGTARQNMNESLKIARHEITITLEEIVVIAKNLLKFRGKFYVVCDADRTAELIFYLKKNNLEPKKMFFTQSAEDSNAILVFIEAVYGAKESVKVLPMVITNDKDGKYLEKIKKMKFE